MHPKLRTADVGDLLPDEAVGGRTVRRTDATAVIVPGPDGLDRYAVRLQMAAGAYAEWDGRVVVLPPDGGRQHRVVLVDRYGQVYAVFEGGEGDLPDASVLEEWFTFLATACPECGVIDDPIGRGWVP